MPEVVDVLYQRWGSYPTFQRTRGVLRLLSLVIHSLKETDKPYISLGDFDLANQEIRQELLKHIGAEFNSIIGADITGKDAASKKVDGSLGNAYKGLKLGTRTATTMFLYSFSGGKEHGVSAGEIKRSATTVGNPASVVAEATEQLKGKLFYLQNVGEKYFFSNQPNLNRIVLTKMDNVREAEITTLEQEILKQSIEGDKFKVFIWEENSANIPDSEDLKLIVLKKENKELMESISKAKGQTPRVNRNTIFYLYPMESERPTFITTMKRKVAFEYIQQDSSLKLSDAQKKEVKKELKRIEAELTESLRRFYRMVGICGKEGVKPLDLGIPTYGEEKHLDREVFDKLRSDSEILESIAPLVIREKHLADKQHVSTKQLYRSSLTTPGETRVVNRQVFEQSISEGVRTGLFGLGNLEAEKPISRYFKEQPTIAFSDNEVLISEAICEEQKRAEEKVKQEGYPPSVPPILGAVGIKEEEKTRGALGDARDEVHLRFKVPKGKVADIMRVMNLLQIKFENLEIDLIATDGSISEQDYEDKIKEAFRQLGIELYL